jgi:geranylgeranyl pyrophosphate synthase
VPTKPTANSSGGRKRRVSPPPPEPEGGAPRDIIAALGFAGEIDQLRGRIADWIATTDPSMREMLKWQFHPRSKYFRPLTIFACHRAKYGKAVDDDTLQRAVVLEMMHNVSLIVDDIVDRSLMRRGVETLHHKFGQLAALMAAGYIVAEGYRMSAGHPHDIRLFSELLKRLGVAECVQWQTRRRPAGYADWRALAQEDTGSMFEVCAALATQDDSLRLFGRLLGMVYHGCDDVADVKGLESLGGGGEDDLRDGILTLPAALAIGDPDIRALFCAANPSDDHLRRIAGAMRDQLPAADGKLDELAMEAKWHAHKNARHSEGLYILVDHTRRLSRQ